MTRLRFCRKSLPWIASVLLLAAFLVGCGPSGRPSATLEGQVTVDGAPANSGKVLVIAGKGSFAGMIEPNGHYRIEGLSLGEAQITVVPLESGASDLTKAVNTPSLPGMPTTTTPPKVENPVPIPLKYGAVSTSGLTTTLKVGKNEFPIPLSSK
jgi:hypothetical protein